MKTALRVGDSTSPLGRAKRRQIGPKARIILPLDHLPDFRADLLSMEADAIYEKWIACEECRGTIDFDVTHMRETIAQEFRVEVNAVKLVGSAKLGFTILDKRRHSVVAGREQQRRLATDHRPMFSEFDVSSDVDVAIVSFELFEDIWKQCFQYWGLTEFNDEPAWPKGREFRDYFFRGWMRPDKLPTGGAFPYSNYWFDYFRQQTSNRLAGDFKITAGLYRDEDFLRHYQAIAIRKCAIAIRAPQ